MRSRPDESVPRRDLHPRRTFDTWCVARLIAFGLLVATSPVAAQVSPVAHENARPGTRDWRLADPAIGREIEGYGSRPSVNVGEAIDLFVNTTAATYSIEVFRLGWYGGQGGRSVLPPVDRAGTVQVIPPADAATGYLECDWVDPYSLHIPDGSGDEPAWVSGIYVAKLSTRPGGKQSYILFIVRDDDAGSTFLFQSGAASFQAVNNWGGRSLLASNSLGEAARRVSFARPYAAGFQGSAATGLGAGELLTNGRADGNLPVAGWEINMVRWLERQGHDVSYTTSVDTHRDPGPLAGHRALLVAGRDEYWTERTHAHVAEAVRGGMSLGIFGARVGDVSIRLEASLVSGAADRAIALESGAGPASASPAILETDAIVTASDHWAFRGTHARSGARLPMVGGALPSRWFTGADSTTSTPAEVMSAASPRAGALGFRATAAGGLIVASGASQWAWALDDFGAPQTRPSAESQVVQRVTENVLERLASTNLTTRLLAPARVTARPSTGAIVVDWQRDAARSDVRYDVYRAATADVVRAGERVAGLQAVSPVVDASVVAGNRYYYAVVAVDSEDRVSPPSQVVSAVASGTAPALAPPEHLTATVLAQGVRLAWSHREPRLVAGYRIYRTPEPTGGSWTSLNPSSLHVSTAFTDGTAGQTSWTYAIAAVGIDGRISNLSNAVRVGGGGALPSDWIPLDIVATYHLAGAEASPEFRLETRDPYQPFPGWVFDGQARYDLPPGELWGNIASFGRFGLTTESLVHVRGREIRIGANMVAGGVVAELWWEGRQFLNNWSFGRQLQTAVRLDPEDRTRPTEGGDQYSAPGPVDLGRVPTGWTHGSPVIELSTSARTLRTVTAPLTWVPESIPGGQGSLVHPMLWRGAFSKSVELDFEGRPNIIRWRSAVTLPGDAPYFEAEVLGAYLTDDFTKAYDFDAEARTVTPRWVAVESCSTTSPPSQAGGIIQSTEDGRFALGLYRRGGQYAVSRFDLCNALRGAGGGTYGYDAVKSSVREAPAGGLLAGTHEFEVFVVVGTFEIVAREMQWLYSNGY